MSTKDCKPKRLVGFMERLEKTLTPTISALLRERPVLLRAHCILTRDTDRPYEGHLFWKVYKEGSRGKAAGGP